MCETSPGALNWLSRPWYSQNKLFFNGKCTEMSNVGGRQGASSPSVYRRRNSPHFLLLPGNHHRMFTLHAVFCYDIPWRSTWTVIYACICCPYGDILIVMLGRWWSHSNIATTWPTHHLYLADLNLPAWLSTGCRGVNLPLVTPLSRLYIIHCTSVWLKEAHWCAHFWTAVLCLPSTLDTDVWILTG